MNRRDIITALIIVAITFGCGGTNKIKMSPNAEINEVIKNYCKSNKRYFNDYSVFHIKRKQIKNQELEVYTILPENDKIAFKIYLEDSLNIEYLPTNYLEYKDKLFLWQEKEKRISDSVMQYIYNKKLVDSSYVMYQMGLIQEEEIQEIFITIDDDVKGVTYIFCKSNPLKIKKKIVSKKYIYPEDMRLQIKCD